MNSSVGFFKALKGTCSGTQIFFLLRKNSWGKTILHLFLLSLICAGFITAVRFTPVALKIQNEASRFQHDFGSIQITPGAWMPEKEPEKARALSFGLTGRVFYLPVIAEDGVVIPEQELALANQIIVWTPRTVVTLMRALDGTWGYYQYSPGHLTLLPKLQYYTNLELSKVLAELREPSQEREGREMVSCAWNDIAGVLIWGVGIGVFLLIFLMAFLLPLFYTSTFVLIFRLGGWPWRAMTLGEVWRIGIYAGFPVMLFASFFPAFELFIRYDTVYMIGLAFYWLFAARKIEQAGIEGGASDE